MYRDSHIRINVIHLKKNGRVGPFGTCIIKINWAHISNIHVYGQKIINTGQWIVPGCLSQSISSSSSQWNWEIMCTKGNNSDKTNSNKQHLAIPRALYYIKQYNIITTLSRNSTSPIMLTDQIIKYFWKLCALGNTLTS